MLSETTSYMKNSGSPEPYLRKIAEAGFSHVHWGHQWDTDFLYSKSEIDQIRTWLKECGLQMLNLHGSAGVEKKWDSPANTNGSPGLNWSPTASRWQTN